MFTSTKQLSGIGSVMRPDGSTVENVTYEIRVHTRWLARLGRTTSGRLRVQRPEAMYWFLESGGELRLTVADGRALHFGVDVTPDHSGWVSIQAGALA